MCHVWKQYMFECSNANFFKFQLHKCPFCGQNFHTADVLLWPTVLITVELIRPFQTCLFQQIHATNELSTQYWPHRSLWHGWHLSSWTHSTNDSWADDPILETVWVTLTWRKILVRSVHNISQIMTYDLQWHVLILSRLDRLNNEKITDDFTRVYYEFITRMCNGGWTDAFLPLQLQQLQFDNIYDSLASVKSIQPITLNIWRCLLGVHVKMPVRMKTKT